jgi:hypothetical protein
MLFEQPSRVCPCSTWPAAQAGRKRTPNPFRTHSERQGSRKSARLTHITDSRISPISRLDDAAYAGLAQVGRASGRDGRDITCDGSVMAEMAENCRCDGVMDRIACVFCNAERSTLGKWELGMLASRVGQADRFAPHPQQQRST